MATKRSNGAFLVILFAAAAVINLGAEYFSATKIIFATKPLLMIFLSSWFYSQARPALSAAQKYVLAGLLFSCAGDTLLMFPENGYGSENLFLTGLAAFLFTHLCYAAAFLQHRRDLPGLLVKRRFFYIIAVIILVANVVYLKPGIPAAMLPAVVTYATAIIFMTLTCLNLKPKINSATFRFLCLGVLLFLFSDTVIGINKFRFPVPGVRLLIMIPYLAGQFLIAKGAARL